MLTVSTVNVNGVRAAAKKGFLEWLSTTQADVVCLQETRAHPDDLHSELREPAGWHAVYADSEQKGRSGVALLSRTAPDAIRVGFGAAEFDQSGRYLEFEFPHVIVASLYLPSGEAGTERQDEKYRFMDVFFEYLVKRAAEAAETDREVLVCGDWNIAHREVDLKNWKANRKSAGFLPDERAWLDRVLGEAGYVDVVRRLYPNVAGPYSWWSYRGKAFDNDTGWRIDYHMSTPKLAESAVSATVERSASYSERWSDHAPVTVSYHWV